MQPLDKIKLINRAVVGIGGQAIQSLTDDTDAAEAALLGYDTVIEDLLARYPWHFNNYKVRLSRVTTPEPIGWTYRFKLAAARIGPPRSIWRRADDAEPCTEYKLELDTVLFDNDECFAVVPVMVEPNVWPAWFRRLAILALQSEYALSIRENAQLSSAKKEQAYGPDAYGGLGGQMAVCRQLDAQSQPSPQIMRGNPLVDAMNLGDAPFGTTANGW